MCVVIKLKNRNNNSIPLFSIPSNNYSFFSNGMCIPQTKRGLNVVVLSLQFIFSIGTSSPPLLMAKTHSLKKKLSDRICNHEN
jgi:hypothetical protein